MTQNTPCSIAGHRCLLFAASSPTELGVHKQIFLFCKYQQNYFSDATEAGVNATIKCADSLMSINSTLPSKQQ
jgi:hypothetical protein